FVAELLGNAPEGGDPQEWLRILTWGQPGHVRVVQPAQDLNGDEIADVVIQVRTTPSLVALDGQGGEPLWWFRGRPPLPDGVDPSKITPKQSFDGGCIGRPALVDVDGDGTPDFIACFLSQGETFATEQGKEVSTGLRGWIEA